MRWIIAASVIPSSCCQIFGTSFTSIYPDIAILFYLWQKSYCFLGNRQQATGNRQQSTGKSFNFFIYFLICRNLFGIAIWMFVAKILLLLREQRIGKSFKSFIYFLICRNLCADCYNIRLNRYFRKG